MNVSVRFLGAVQDITRSVVLDLEYPSGVSVSDVLRDLSARYGARFDEVINKGGRVGPEHVLMVDGISVALLQGLATRLEEDCTLTILVPLGGGWVS